MIGPTLARAWALRYQECDVWQGWWMKLGWLGW